MERNEPTNLEDPNPGAFLSLSSPLVGDYEGGTKKMEGNDYEVFLSFRGKDTRKGFTDHLYTSLVDAGIHVFRDNNELRFGEEIGPELLYSITQSKISIAIISENYASSKWCLHELTQMLKCKRSKGQVVLPIFYKVEPSQVRHPVGRFRDAINANRKNLGDMVVKEWEEALEEVSYLKGWESEKFDNGHEATLVKSVVKRVTMELRRTYQLIVPEQFVGIDERVEEIMSLIDPKCNDTRIIGIYGMGGIGKTTLARVLYNNLSIHFEHHSFMANVRETSMHKSIEYLQKQLICGILRSPYVVSNVYEGISVIKSRFIGKKVLIILDDIDDNTQLNALAGDSSWFKAGSIVIITTRNKRILDEARADHMYPLNELPLDKSLILFNRHAFRKNSPQRDYEVISRDVVCTTGGLPLALEIIGSFLWGRTEKVWKDTLKKLKKVPDKKVQETLRISYNALEYEEQQIFLDIACFFIESSKKSPTYMWDDCGFFPEKGIEVLSLMSLIKIDEDGNLMMHDQLRDFGREIVRLENQREPQNRSRLWNSEEAADVIDNNKGTSMIEALCLSEYDRERSYAAEKFKDLTNLRFLQMDGVNLTGNYQNLLPQLRWIEWGYCCLDFGVANFHLKNLIVLDLLCSQISEDWGGWGPLKMATKLKVLNLMGCALRTTPDLSAYRSLEILILEDCKDLEKIHPSINDIHTLISLNVNRCLKLKELPLGVCRMEELRELLLNETKIREIPIAVGYLTKLETLKVARCEQLARLPEYLGCLVSLTQLHLTYTEIEELPESIGSLKKLKTLDASYCASLARIPSSIGHLASLSLLDLRGCDKLAQLPETIGSLTSLQRLLLSECHSLKEMPDSIGKLESLIELHLKSTAFEELPEFIGSLKKLKTLDASCCASLACIPNSISHLASLSLLDLSGCDKLAQLPDTIGSLTSLQRLLLSECHSLKEMPDSTGKLESLTELHLESTAFEKLPEFIGSLKKLKTLDAFDCASLACIPNSIGHLASLTLLDLSGCDKLAQLPDTIGSLTSLQRLLLSECHSLKEMPDSTGKLESLTELHLESTAFEKLPEFIGSLKKLKTLDASYCASLACIPNSIGHLASLTLLDLRGCDKLAQLPDTIGSLTSLQSLFLSGCPLLREMPDSIGKLESLTELHLKSTAFEELPEFISSLKKLKTLDVSCCASLARIPNSIGHLASLSLLDLSGCDKLAQLPDTIGSLTSLRRLLLSECHSLKEMPDSTRKLESLTELHLESTAFEKLPEFIGSLKKLKTLDASYCASLACIPNSIGHLASLTLLDLSGCDKLAQLPDTIGSLTSLQSLFLSGCPLLREMPDSIGKLESLTELHLKSTAFEELPEFISSLKKLKTLNVSCCASLARIPNSIGHLASLSLLDLSGCDKLAQLPDTIGSLTSLQRLLLSECHSLKEMPDSIGKLESLTELHLKSTTFEELPEFIGTLKKLKTLDASCCASLACIPNSISHLASLSLFDLSGCDKLAQLPATIGSLTSLQSLFLSGCPLLREMPDSIGKLESLTELHLKSTAFEELPEFISSLKKLKTLDASCCASLACIPNSIGHLASLSLLDLSGCDKLAQLPDTIGSLTSLQSLLLSGCPLLREMPDSIGKLESLIELRLKSTAFEELPEFIGSLKKLKTLDASCCASLACIPNSIGHLASLSLFDLSGCDKLAQLPATIGSLTSLQSLFLSGCPLLREMPDSIGKLESLTELHLKSTAFEELPEFISSLKKLKTLDASCCASLACIPNSIGHLASLSLLDLSGCDKLAQLPDTIGSLTSLQSLLLSGCPLLREMPDSIGKLESLIELRLKSTAFEELPEFIGSLKKLKTLDASCCASLACIPNSIGHLASLSLLDLRGCGKLAQLPDTIGSLTSLQSLLFTECHSLREMPDSTGKLESLTELHLKSTAFEELPEFIGSLKKLKTLDASYCASLACIPSSIGHLASLSLLDLRGCYKLVQLPDTIGSLTSLQRLLLSGCLSLKEIPDSIGKLESLTELHLKSTTFEKLPKFIGSLRKLKTLDASYCASLARIPSSIGHLVSLCLLDLRGCDKLAQLPDTIGSLTSLQRLLLSGCHSLREIPYSTGNLKALTELHLKSTMIMELPENIGDMKNLRMLDINGTPMTELLDDRGLLAEFQELRPLGGKNPKGPAERVSLDNLDLDKHQKLSELRSRVLALVFLKCSRPPLANNSAMDYQTTNSEHVLKRSRPFGILDENSETMANKKPRIAVESGDKLGIWKLTEINEPSQCSSIRLPENFTATKVSRLIYTNSGLGILALSSNAVHKFWKWQKSDWNLTGRATTSVVPQLWQHAGGNLMTNDTSHINPEDAVPCFALSKTGCYLISASGGEISLFNMRTFETMITFMPPAPQDTDTITIGIEDSSIQIYSGQIDEKKLKGHQRIIKGFAFSTSLNVLMPSEVDSQTMTTFTSRPPPATFLAFYPQDNNIIAIGMEDSSVQIYNVRVDELKANLRGHQKRITGLAFSNVLNVLVSSGADSQLCVWSTDGWEKQASKFLQLLTGRGAAPLVNTRVQFHVDQIHLLAVHETQIVIYKAPTLECLKQWVPREDGSLITDATYSCNGQSIYASFKDGSIGVLTASTLGLRCHINSTAYIPPNPTLRVYPLVIAAHPSKPNQFALGLTDSSVYVLEPLEYEGEWGTSPPVEYGAGPSTISSATGSDQRLR